MRKRPFSLFLFSISMLAIAISLPLQVIFLQDFEEVFQSLTVLNIIIMILCAAAAYTSYNLHKWFLYLLPLVITAVVFNNWWVGYVGFHFSLYETTLASAGFLTLCSALLEKNTFTVLCNPKLKWWDVTQRAKIEIPVTLTPFRGQALTKTSFDISESGIFLQGLGRDELERLNIGEKYTVCLNFTKIIKIRAEAKIVRKSLENGSYPTGVGLQFERIDEQIKSSLRKLTEPKSLSA